MKDPDKERVLAIEFQRRRKRCGYALVLLVLAFIDYVFLRSYSDRRLEAFDSFFGIPFVVHLILIFVIGFGSVIFMVVNFRCPNCNEVPRVPKRVHWFVGPEYTPNPEQCHACGIRLKNR